jgi:hypothetical protein
MRRKPIVDPLSFPTIKNEFSISQYRHMTGYFGLRLRGRTTEIADAQFSSLSEKHDDSQPCFIRQNFEELNGL